MKSLLGPDFTLLAKRGEVFPDAQGRLVLVTVHPSAVLRAPDEESRHAQYQAFVRDLRRAAETLQGTATRRK